MASGTDNHAERSAELPLVRALDALGHELRNAAATVLTATDLLRDADPAECAEIAADLRAPAQMLALCIDLVSASARGHCRPGEPEPVELASALALARQRALRGGLALDIRNSEPGHAASTVPDAFQRLVCAAALATGHQAATVSIAGAGVLEVRGDAGASAMHDRLAKAAALLVDELAVAAGARVERDGEALRLVFDR